MKKFRGTCITFLNLILLLTWGCALPQQRIVRFGKLTKIQTTNLAEDTVWEGEIVIDGVVTIPSGLTLTIKPGTIIKFVPTTSTAYGAGGGIIVNGTLVARGTKKAKIIFTSAAKKPAKGDWNDIFFIVSEGDENILDHCVIRYANIGVHGHFCKLRVTNCDFSDNWRAFQFQEAEFEISDCNLINNNYGIRFRDSEVRIHRNQISDSFSGIEAFRSQVVIKDNQVKNCYLTSIKFREAEINYIGNSIENCRFGLQVNDSSQVEITDSDFINNYESGIYLKNSLAHLKRNNIKGNGGDGISIKDTGLNLNYNNIINNGKYAVDNSGKSSINAQYNWWGNTDILDIAQSIYDYFDNSDLGKVDFALFLSEPIKQLKDIPPQEPR